MVKTEFEEKSVRLIKNAKLHRKNKVNFKKKSNHRTKVAVITATRNRENYLKRCIESVSNQSYRNFEHIVVDDDSSDGTWSLLQELNKRYLHLKIYKIKHKKSGGARARNFAVKQTQASYICHLDDDDLYHSDHIESLMSFLYNNKEYKWAYTAAQVSNDGENITSIWNYDFTSFNIRSENRIPLPTVMHRKEIWQEAQGMDEDIGIYEDWDLWRRWISLGLPPTFINYPTVIVDSFSTRSIQRGRCVPRKIQQAVDKWNTLGI